MIPERKGLYSLVDESIEKQLNGEEQQPLRFKAYLKKDAFDVYSLLDCEGHPNCSIKCIFNESGLNNYLETLPSYMSYDSLESKNEIRNKNINMNKFIK